MSLTTRVLTGLVIGLVAGIALSGATDGWLAAIPGVVEPIGTLWVNAIRMTVVPLVVSLLIVTIAGEERSGAMLKLGGRTILLFVGMVAAACVFTALLAPPLLALFPIDPETAATLRASSSADVNSVELPPFRDWLVDLIPANPLAAAADGAMLPLIIFTALFAFAITRIGGGGREALVRFFAAVRDAMFVLIEWILFVAPIGVLALVLPLAARMGASAAGALGYSVLVSSGLIALAVVGLYPLAVVVGRVRPSDFARALAPAQAVGFSTRSSLASLPAMMAATETLGLRERVAGVVIPVAVATFKWASPIGRGAGTFFVARLYGIELGLPEVMAIAGAVGLLSFYSPGIPSGGLLIMTPVFMSLGLPIEGIGILIALDLIVDMFITLGNVTANVTAAVVLTRSDRIAGSEDTVPGGEATS
ncbi:MAG: dicarboxylate/amino acid:cation symporter [Gemmatimonadetes bacterium]|nr:dicarboxylate/amino acid:cation symporter [Gemmatimonadota bacterium]